MKKEKKVTIMSLSLDVEIQARLKELAAERQITVSKLIRDLADKYLTKAGEEDADTVIFRIPHSIKADREKLQNWLEVRTAAVARAMCP